MKFLGLITVRRLQDCESIAGSTFNCSDGTGATAGVGDQQTQRQGALSLLLI